MRHLYTSCKLRDVATVESVRCTGGASATPRGSQLEVASRRIATKASVRWVAAMAVQIRNKWELWMQSVTSWAAFAFRRVNPGGVHALATIEAACRHVERVSIRPQPYGPPKRLRKDVSVTVERWRGWPVYTVAPNGEGRTGSTVYVHGGAWVNEISPQSWQLVAQIAAETGSVVTVPIYPLIPFGTAAQVVPMIAELVLDNISKYGPTCLAGDSAGGQIALSAALQLRDTDDVTLPRTVLISPALDLTLSNPMIDCVQPSDPWLRRDGLRVVIEYWRGELELDDPLVSPLAAELDGLGPLSVFSGTRDILNPDARVLVVRSYADAVKINYHERWGQVHTYPLMPTPEGHDARVTIVDSLRQALSAR